MCAEKGKVHPVPKQCGQQSQVSNFEGLPKDAQVSTLTRSAMTPMTIIGLAKSSDPSDGVRLDIKRRE